MALVVGCGEAGGRPDARDSGAADIAETADTADTGETGPCPDGMVLLDQAVCIDVAEARLEERVGDEWVAASPYEVVAGREVRAVVATGEVPQGYISGDEASAACEASGKRLCTDPEWLLACQGAAGTTWPYGNTYDVAACNDHYAGGHPVCDYFGTCDGVWDAEHMNDPGINQQAGTVAASGAFAACVSGVGAFDLHGNLHEWIADEAGSFRGGFYADAEINGEGCTSVTTAHDRSYHDYSTGFRCCARAR